MIENVDLKVILLYANPSSNTTEYTALRIQLFMWDCFSLSKMLYACYYYIFTANQISHQNQDKSSCSEWLNYCVTDFFLCTRQKKLMSYTKKYLDKIGASVDLATYWCKSCLPLSPDCLQQHFVLCVLVALSCWKKVDQQSWFKFSQQCNKTRWLYICFHS